MNERSLSGAAAAMSNGRNCGALLTETGRHRTGSFQARNVRSGPSGRRVHRLELTQSGLASLMPFLKADAWLLGVR
jgi:hypothetical protein